MSERPAAQSCSAGRIEAAASCVWVQTIIAIALRFGLLPPARATVKQPVREVWRRSNAARSYLSARHLHTAMGIRRG